MAELPAILFNLIQIVRVYAKPPGKKVDTEDPFTLPVGSDVHALSRKVYHGDVNRVRSARVWGHGVIDGQNVHLDHVRFMTRTSWSYTPDPPCARAGSFLTHLGQQPRFLARTLSPGPAIAKGRFFP